jgi:hypothetical protein
MACSKPSVGLIARRAAADKKARLSKIFNLIVLTKLIKALVF